MKIYLKQQTNLRKKKKKIEIKKKFPLVGIEPRTIDGRDHHYIYCAKPRRANSTAKSTISSVFAHEIQPVNVV